MAEPAAASPQPAPARPTKAEVGLPLNLDDGTWTVAGQDSRSGEIILQRPAGLGFVEKTLSQEEYKNARKRRENVNRRAPKRYMGKNVVNSDTGVNLDVKGFDAVGNRFLVSGSIKGKSVDEWVDASLINAFTNPLSTKKATDDLAKSLGFTDVEAKDKQRKEAGAKEKAEAEAKKPAEVQAVPPSTAAEEIQKQAPVETEEEEEEQKVAAVTEQATEKGGAKMPAAAAPVLGVAAPGMATASVPVQPAVAPNLGAAASLTPGRTAEVTAAFPARGQTEAVTPKTVSATLELMRAQDADRRAKTTRAETSTAVPVAAAGAAMAAGGTVSSAFTVTAPAGSFENQKQEFVVQMNKLQQGLQASSEDNQTRQFQLRAQLSDVDQRISQLGQNRALAPEVQTRQISEAVTQRLALENSLHDAETEGRDLRRTVRDVTDLQDKVRQAPDTKMLQRLQGQYQEKVAPRLSPQVVQAMAVPTATVPSPAVQPVGGAVRAAARAVGAPGLPVARPPVAGAQAPRPITPIPIKPPIVSRPGISPELGRAVEFGAAQEAARGGEEAITDTYEQMIGEGGGTGMGVIETVPKSYATEEGVEGPETDLGKIQSIRGKEAEMRKIQAQFLGGGLPEEGVPAAGERPSAGRPSKETATARFPAAPTSVEEALGISPETQRQAALEQARQDALAQREEQAEGEVQAPPPEDAAAKAIQMAANNVNRGIIFAELVSLNLPAAVVSADIAVFNGAVTKIPGKPQATGIEAAFYLGCLNGCLLLTIAAILFVFIAIIMIIIMGPCLAARSFFPTSVMNSITSVTSHFTSYCS